MLVEFECRLLDFGLIFCRLRAGRPHSKVEARLARDLRTRKSKIAVLLIYFLSQQEPPLQPSACWRAICRTMLCSSCNHNQAAKACCNAQCGACCPGGCKHKKHKNGGSSTPAAGTHKEKREKEVVGLKSTISSKRSASAVAQAVTPSPVAKKKKKIGDDGKKEDGVLGAETKDEEEGNAAGDKMKIQHEDRATKEQAAPSAEDGDKDEPFGDKVIFSFFQKISDKFGDDEYDIEGTIDQYPGLMKATCPEGVNDEWEGMTLFECLCYSQEAGSGGKPDARDLMYELVCRGAVATEECYASIAEVGYDHINMDLMLVLVISGHLPLKSKYDDFTLDEWFQGCGDSEDIDEILKVLLGEVKAGSWLGCGDITERVAANFEHLPKLEAGVTHEAGGDFAQYLSKYQTESST